MILPCTVLVRTNNYGRDNLYSAPTQSVIPGTMAKYYISFSLQDNQDRKKGANITQKPNSG